MSFQDYADSLGSRLRLGKFGGKAVVGIIALALVATASCSYIFFTQAFGTSEVEEGVEFVESGAKSDDGADEEENLSSIAYVHVAGCVKTPGVYALESNCRIDKAIEAAGGFTKKADTNAINLAEKVADGQQIIVPEKAEVGSSNASSGQSGELSAASSGTSASLPNGSTSADSGTGMVNINTASSQELQTLSGIGEAKAAKIIDYREANGFFKSVDQLTNVSGIGDKTLESIRSSICV